MGRARALFCPSKAKDKTKPHIDVDADPVVSRGTDPGVWVQAWLWIPNEVTDGEKEAARGRGGEADG